MPVPENYAASERLRDGRSVEIRMLRADDEEDMLAAIGRTSSQSLQRRLFGPKRSFSKTEVDFFMNIDFTSHVALIALADEDEHEVIIGGGRYVVTDSGMAEIAFVTIDDYQGLGVGTLLMRHLIILARAAGLEQLVADVLPENTAMRKVFAKFGFQVRRGRDPQVVCLALPL